MVSQSSNQQCYDTNQHREKQCIAWLKQKKKSVKRQINVVALLGLANGVFIILQSALLAYIFHQLVIEKQSWTLLLSSFVQIAVVFVFRSVCQYFQQTLGFKVAVVIKRGVRSELLEQFERLGISYIKTQNSGEVATVVLEHVEALENYFARYAPQQMIVSILPLIMIAIVMPINWVVGIIFLITGPLILVFMALVGMGANSANRNQFLEMARMSGYFLDRLEGLVTLKLFAQAEAQVKSISDISTLFRQKTMAVLRIAFLSSAVLEFFSAVAVALVAVYVGLGLLGLVHFGPAVNINLQEALFVLLLAPEFFNPLKKLAVFYHDKAAAVGATDHILKILEQDYPCFDQHLSTNSEFSIELKNVTKRYQDKSVLKGLNIQISAGEKIALMGESGAGKTTLFQLILGFENVTEGEVLVGGKKACLQITEKKIAWAGQQSTVFYASINDNISLLNSDISPQQINSAAEMAGVTAFSQHLDDGLYTFVGEKGHGLSGGQVQRIMLARAFVKNSPIVLLDEPTAHLDQQNKTKLLDAIERLFKDKTLIIASHDAEVRARMDRTIELK